MSTPQNTPNPPSTQNSSVVLRGFLSEAALLPPREGFPEGARAAIVCGSCLVELYGEALKPLVGRPAGTPVQVFADVRAERARAEGRDRAQTFYRFRVQSVQ